jgi:hypothetical protein
LSRLLQNERDVLGGCTQIANSTERFRSKNGSLRNQMNSAKPHTFLVEGTANWEEKNSN